MNIKIIQKIEDIDDLQEIIVEMKDVLQSQDLDSPFNYDEASQNWYKEIIYFLNENQHIKCHFLQYIDKFIKYLKSGDMVQSNGSYKNKDGVRKLILNKGNSDKNIEQFIHKCKDRKIIRYEEFKDELIKSLSDCDLRKRVMYEGENVIAKLEERGRDEEKVIFYMFHCIGNSDLFYPKSDWGFFDRYLDLHKIFMYFRDEDFNYCTRRPELKIFARNYTRIFELLNAHFLRWLNGYDAHFTFKDKVFNFNFNRFYFICRTVPLYKGKELAHFYNEFANYIMNIFFEFIDQGNMYLHYKEYEECGDEFYARTKDIMEFFTGKEFDKKLQYFLEKLHTILGDNMIF